MDLALQILVVIAAMMIGARYKGIGLGIWGGFGLLILTLFFGIKPTKPPIDVILIILSVVTAVAVMHSAGGLDFMIRIAEKIIRANPSRIVFVAPLTCWFFTFLGGTAHICNSLMPVIYEVSYSANIRPERSMAASLAGTQQALVASPTAACTAALLGLLAARDPSITLGHIIGITIPATLVSCLVVSCCMFRYGKELKDDAEYQERVRQGLVQPPKPISHDPLPKGAKISALIFVLAVVYVVAAGFFPILRTPHGAKKALGMATFLQLVMLSAAAIMLVVCKPQMSTAMKSPMLKAGLTAAISLMGVAWLGDSFFAAHKAACIASVGSLMKEYPWLFALFLFAGGSVINSQAATVRALMPLGIALGMPTGQMIGVMPAVNSTSFFPTAGILLATLNYDQSGTCKIGKWVLNHSFMLPTCVGTFTSTAMALLIQSFFF